MAIDETKLAFSSQWDIDKVVDYRTTSASVSAGSNSTATVSHSYGNRPYVIAQYKPTTQTTWFEAGENSLFSTSQLVDMHVWITSSSIQFRVNNNHGGTVTVDIRYWVLSDGN